MQAPDRMLIQGGRLLAGEALRFDVTPSGLHHALPGLGLCDVDLDGWRLVVGGHTRYALGLSLAGVQRRPARTAPVVLQTPGLPGAASQARWTGTPLSQVLHEAAPLDGAGHVVFNGLDRGIVDGAARRGEICLPLEMAMAEDVMLAWAMNGDPLPLEHGHPLRLLVPGREEWASLR
ncbi:MAG: molybdopterin-dependent oxidoreductase [Candidatus Dormibacteraceae bacterium]